MGLAIHLLGAPRVILDGCVRPAPRGQKVWAVLAMLVRSQRPLARQQLADMLFAQAEDPRAALRWTLSELRRLLGVGGLRGEDLALSLDRAVYVDVHVVTQGQWAEALEVPGLDQPLLGGLHIDACPGFEVWLDTERRHVQATVEAVLREAALARLAAGAYGQACDWAGRLVQKNPLDENYQALLVRCLAASGDGVGAARQVAACRALFMKDLGVLPGPALDEALRTSTATTTQRPVIGSAAVQAQIEAGQAAMGAGAVEAGLQCLRQAVAQSASAGVDLQARALVALGGALVHAARGCDDEGAAALHQALGLVAGEPVACAAAACRELAYVEFLRGRYERAQVLLHQAVAMAGQDRAELARIATVHGSVLSDTAHYGASLCALQTAQHDAQDLGDAKQAAYALSMLGRCHLLQGELQPACAALDQAIAITQQQWTAFLPWPESLRADADMALGQVGEAADRFEHAFALGCQLGDPCWESLAGRGLARVARQQGQIRRAVELHLDAIQRSTRLPDAYVWAQVYALESLCELAVAEQLPQAPAWVDELQTLAARSGMRELTVRALLHRYALGDTGSLAAAHWMAQAIGNPCLQQALEHAGLRH